MHASAMNNCKLFFDTYSRSFDIDKSVRVVEIGSQDVNGSLRQLCPNEFEYVGLDFQDAKGVDVIINDPYALPLESESVDIVLSSSCFEHSEMFWLVFLEVMRVLKPKGLFYLNVPSTGAFHRYPVDCWRFYPDSGSALVEWAKRNSISAALLESYIEPSGMWKDCVSVFLKDSNYIDFYKERILDKHHKVKNGKIFGQDKFINSNENEINVSLISIHVPKPLRYLAKIFSK